MVHTLMPTCTPGNAQSRTSSCPCWELYSHYAASTCTAAGGRGIGRSSPPWPCWPVSVAEPQLPTDTTHTLTPPLRATVSLPFILILSRMTPLHGASAWSLCRTLVTRLLPLPLHTHPHTFNSQHTCVPATPAAAGTSIAACSGQASSAAR